MVHVIKETIKSKCAFYNSGNRQNSEFYLFLINRFAVNFVTSFNLNWHDDNYVMWTCYYHELDERWTILEPIWISYLAQTGSCTGLKPYIFKKQCMDGIKKPFEEPRSFTVKLIMWANLDRKSVV